METEYLALNKKKTTQYLVAALLFMIFVHKNMIQNTTYLCYLC